MDLVTVVRELEAERSKLDRAIAALVGLNGTQPGVEVTAETLTPRRKKRFSKATRAKMALVQKQRWAKWHKEHKRG